MLSILIQTTDNDHLGRVDPSVFSSQTLMELVVQDLPDKSRFQDVNKDFLQIGSWRGVKFNDQSKITDIYWTGILVRGGSVHLEWVPEAVTYFSAKSAHLSGEIDFTRLSTGLEVLLLGNNGLTGGVDLSALPIGMRILNGNINKFTGSLDMTRLPVTMYSLRFMRNALSGSIDVGHLPPTMHDIFLSDNRFSGSLNLTALPPALFSLHLKANNFSGEVIFENKPNALACINISLCKIEKVVDLNGDVVTCSKIIK